MRKKTENVTLYKIEREGEIYAILSETLWPHSSRFDFRNNCMRKANLSGYIQQIRNIFVPIVPIRRGVKIKTI